jgi:hypothetical protein
MNRRQLLTLALAASALALSGKSSGAKSRKKGLCLSTKKRPAKKVAQFVKSTGARWLYNWNINPPEHLPTGVDYFPMIYNGKSVKDANLAHIMSQARVLRYSSLLGFNEPDAKSQGDTTVEEALDLWPKLESTGLRLGSPGCVHPDNEWMIEFMNGVEKRGLRVDFVCVHSYGGPGAKSLVKRLEKVHALYKRPIWITEFAVADWKAKSGADNRHKPEQVADFVTELLPQLEAMDIVERYAWFHGGVSGGPLATSKLFNPDGSLTIVGKAYRAVG